MAGFTGGSGAAGGPGGLIAAVLALAILGGMLWWSYRNAVREAVLTGFRIVREHPRVLLVWSLCALVLSLLYVLIMAGVGGPDLARLQAQATAPSSDPAVAVALFQKILPAYLLILAVGLLFNAVLGAAMIRAVLRPEEERLGYLRLGADELRQLGLGLVTVLFFMAVYFGMAIVAGVLSSVAVMAGRADAVSVMALLAVGGGGVMVYLGVRLSLAPALTFESRRVNLFGSWRLTSGRFTPLFATYFLTMALVTVVYLLCLLIIMVLGAALNGGDMARLAAAPDLSSVAAYFTPWRIAQTLLTSVVSALVWPVAFTPPTAMYRRVVPSGAAAADAFS